MIISRVKFPKFKVLSQGEFVKLKEADGERLKLETKNSALLSKIEVLEERIRILKQSDENTDVLIPIDLKDPVPEDGEAYDAYVARVAAFHKEVLGPKLNQMLSKLHSELEDMGNDRDSDLVIKGVAYAFRELKRWGERMVNKQVAKENNN